MNFRIRDWKDFVVFITTWLISPIIVFFIGIIKGEKRLKDMNFLLFLDLILFMLYLFFIVCVWL